MEVSGRFSFIAFIVILGAFLLSTVAISDDTGGTLLFQENFEDSSFGSRGWYDHTGLTLSSEEHVPGSTSSAQFRWTTGTSAPPPGGAIRRKFTATDSVYVSYFVKYSSDYTGSNKLYGPHEFYILTNKNGDLDGPAYSHLTTYIEQNEGVPSIAIQDAGNINTSFIGQDLTGITESRAVAGCNGNSNTGGTTSCYQSGNYYNGYTWRAPAVYFSDSQGATYKNNWHLVEAYFQMNTIYDGKGQKDGVIQYRYDGNLTISRNDVVFRTAQNSDMHFNQFMIGPYIGDGSPVDQSFWIDDLVLATGRVSDWQARIPRAGYLDTVQKVYIGYYQRPADPGGLLYWAGRVFGTNGNLRDIVEAFANSEESQALYGPIDASNISDVIKAIYRALFSRDAEPGGLSWYINGFNSSTYTPATIMLDVLYGARNEDLRSIDNKLAAANLFTMTIDPELDGKDFRATYADVSDAIGARAFLVSVTGDPGTVPTQDETTAYIKDHIADRGDLVLNQ